MLEGSGLNCANYENTLIGWNSQSVTGRTLGATGLNYGSAANAARANLVLAIGSGGKGWTITGDNSSNVCDAFITTWDLSIGGNATSLSIPTNTNGSVSYSWSEIGGSATSASGLTFSGNTLSISGLPSGKKIRLRISPTNFQRIIFSNGGDKTRLLDVEQWGTTVWTKMTGAFAGCTNLNITATGIPNLSWVTDMSSMFQGCGKLNGPANIGSWNVSTITNMTSMFNGCTLFNQNIGNWNTANVITMQNMFLKAGNFNQNIGGWNTANLARTTGMFNEAYAFNQDISGWNTAAVTLMDNMFHHASSFNQNISGWNTAKVTSMNAMFRYATSFNQNLGNWTLNASVNMTQMLEGSGLNCNNYSATLIGWNSQSVTGRTLGATGLKYGSYASSARTTLTTATGSGGKGWTITDGGQGTCSAPQGSVQMIDFGGFIKHDVTNLDKPLNVYPNPATDLINLEFNGIAPSTFNVLVMDMSGKVIIKLNGVHAESNQYTLPLNGIVSGMYVVKLSDELGNTTINRFNIK
jgi:surface protein